MKILFIGSDDYNQAYTRVRCYKFSQLLRDCGYRTEVFSFQDRYYPGTEPFFMLNLGDLDKIKVTVKALKSLWREKHTLFYIQKAHYHAAVPFLLSRLGRNAYILDYDDWELDRATFFNSSLLNKFFFGASRAEDIARIIASRARGCVVSTAPLVELMERYNPRVYLIPTAADTGRFAPVPSSKRGERVVFIWSGLVWGMDVYESVIFMIDCFRSVHDFHRDSELIIAGKGGMYDKMRYEIAGRFKGLPIVVSDWVHPDEMPELLSRADVGLLPLVSNEKNINWMRCKCPTKLFEFMAMGMPTVSSDFGEVRSIINDGEDGFLAGGREDFVRKMKLLADDRALREKMGRMAREKAVARYSLHAQRDLLCRVIDTAAADGGRPPSVLAK